jgi:hypothetical protein
VFHIQGAKCVPALAALVTQDEQAEEEDHKEDHRHEHQNEGAGDEGEDVKKSHRQRARSR